MNRLAFALMSLPLVACYGGERASSGQCPAGETCSTLTPYGLHFIGNGLVDDLLLTGPAPTAVGGTQDVALQYDRGDGVLIALELPYIADDDGGAGVRVEHSTGSVVTIRGAGSRTNYLRVLDAGDGLLFDRKQLTGATVDSIELVATDFEDIPAGSMLAWAAGEQKLGVALLGQVQESLGPTSERLVDTSMQLTLAGGERLAWDTLHVASATVGTYPISVTAGDKPAATLDMVVVDHADTLAPMTPSPDTIQTNGSTQVCFAATSLGRYIVGLTWSFVIDGVTTPQGAVQRNCITASTQKTTGMVTVQGSAGGRSAMVSLIVGASARTLPGTGAHVRLGGGATAGDRAAM